MLITKKTIPTYYSANHFSSTSFTIGVEAHVCGEDLGLFVLSFIYKGYKLNIIAKIPTSQQPANGDPSFQMVVSLNAYLMLYHHYVLVDQATSEPWAQTESPL